MRRLALIIAVAACGPPASGDRGGGGNLDTLCWNAERDPNCAIKLDATCMEGSVSDELRNEGCLMMALANADRRLFLEESASADELIWDERLFQVAQGHVEDMCAREYFEHETPEGLGPNDRSARLGFDFSVAENIVFGANSVNNHFLWMNEPTCTGHRGNILNPKNRRVGVAVIRCQSGRFAGRIMAVQNFHMNHAIDASPACGRDDFRCMVPPDPVSFAAGFCTDCTANGSEMLAEWGCP
jgi:hypothetical protein